MSGNASTPLLKGFGDNPNEPVAGAALLAVHKEDLCHPSPFTLVDNLPALFHHHHNSNNLALYHIVTDTYDGRHTGIRSGKVLGSLWRPDKPIMLFLLNRLGLFRTELILHIEDVLVVSAKDILEFSVNVLDNAAMT